MYPKCHGNHSCIKITHTHAFCRCADVISTISINLEQEGVHRRVGGNSMTLSVLNVIQCKHKANRCSQNLEAKAQSDVEEGYFTHTNSH